MPSHHPPRLKNDEEELDMKKLIEDFEKFCSSDALSIDLLKEWLKVVPLDAVVDSEFLHNACCNDHVTLEIVETLLDFYPGAVRIQIDWLDGEADVYPLHIACYYDSCPSSVIQLLINKFNSALRYGCAIDGGVTCEYYDFQNEVARLPHSDGANGLPIHYYLMRKGNIDLDIVEMMVREFPEALTRSDDEVIYTPIHVLMYHWNIEEMYDIAKFLIESNTSSLQISSGYEGLPLHIACGNLYISSDIIRLLVNTWPQAVNTANEGGFFPLHLICCAIQRTSTTTAGVDKSTEEEDKIALEIVRFLIDESHLSVSQTTEDEEYLPIHYAASYKSSEICTLLLNAYPESWKIGIRSDGSLPIHNACSYGRIETVKMLLERYPESLHLRDAHGFLPIHLASKWRDPNGLFCDGKDKLNSVSFLFNLYPEAIMKADASGRLPLDIIRNSIESCGDRFYNGEDRADSVKLEAFLQTQMNYAHKAEDREAMTAPDSEGMLPLHRAICSGACLGAVKLLLKGNPEAIQSADLKGNLPIHLASKSSSADVVKFLADTHPNSLTTCNAEEDSALHCACLTGNDIETVQYLLDRQVASVSQRNSDGMLPIHIFCDPTGKRWNYQDTPLYVEIVMRLLLAYPETIGTELQNRS